MLYNLLAYNNGLLCNLLAYNRGLFYNLLAYNNGLLYNLLAYYRGLLYTSCVDDDTLFRVTFRIFLCFVILLHCTHFNK